MPAPAMRTMPEGPPVVPPKVYVLECHGPQANAPLLVTGVRSENAAVAELLRTIDQMQEQCASPIRGAAAYLTGILTDHRLPDTA